MKLVPVLSGIGWPVAASTNSNGSYAVGRDQIAGIAVPFRCTTAAPEPTLIGVGDRASTGDGTYTVEILTTLRAEI
jgi:hypothetical protein